MLPILSNSFINYVSTLRRVVPPRLKCARIETGHETRPTLAVAEEIIYATKFGNSHVHSEILGEVLEVETWVHTHLLEGPLQVHGGRGCGAAAASRGWKPRGSAHSGTVEGGSYVVANSVHNS